MNNKESKKMSQALPALFDVILHDTSLIKPPRTAHWYGQCPFCKSERLALSVRKEEGLFFCHDCQASGDVISYYMKKHGINFKTACAELAEWRKVLGAGT